MWGLRLLRDCVVNEAIEKYRVWLLKKYNAFTSELVELLEAEDTVCQVCSVCRFLAEITALRTAILFCQKGDYQQKEPAPQFDTSLFNNVPSCNRFSRRSSARS